ncbi:hypothetical protein M0812_23341 [Anaeramoeba flamelloides]|uniref:Uncharacterized protein n=1 Tax=Anaeramoeba flamelloides TaxID=1746091 RepID=A0AAV7YKF6_9EUKA|nr:hypothetical protein M0812_23341 [Anaeramoeba flamelloides]|eukprot:Anaeramoba_flamelloidesc37591_g1_i1.p1 GENE.c37591_g1_i1~~c37591_g1_i1.p1  ORF type:complete len:165 (-),score=43.85 c37591_g1_i1:68-514(-)
MKTYLFVIAILIFGSFVFCEHDDGHKYTMNLYNNKNCEGSKDGQYQFQNRERKKAKDNKFYQVEAGSGEKFQFRRCKDEDDEDCEEVTTFELGECKPITDIEDEETLKKLLADEDDSWGDTQSFEFSGSLIIRFSLTFFAFSIIFFFI